MTPRTGGFIGAGTPLAGRAAMSRLGGHAADYLALRRALGFKLEKEGRLLPDFAAFAEAAGAGTVTVDLRRLGDAGIRLRRRCAAGALAEARPGRLRAGRK